MGKHQHCKCKECEGAKKETVPGWGIHNFFGQAVPVPHHPVIQKANCVLGCIQSSRASRARERILPLCSGGTPPGTLHPALGAQHWKDIDMLECVQRRATRLIRGIEHLSCEERLGELVLFSLEKKRLQDDLNAVFQYLKGTYTKKGERYFTRAQRQDKVEWLKTERE
ncbi:hypothetical protein BTVI_45914 [Pitangus sulphuratus]|nr:hypothetical protein BTVI_45914 [Pitangus sulphuratus]